MMGYNTAGTYRAGPPCQPPWAALQSGCLLSSFCHPCPGGLISLRCEITQSARRLRPCSGGTCLRGVGWRGGASTLAQRGKMEKPTKLSHTAFFLQPSEIGPGSLSQAPPKL